MGGRLHSFQRHRIPQELITDFEDRNIVTSFGRPAKHRCFISSWSPFWRTPSMCMVLPFEHAWLPMGLWNAVVAMPWPTSQRRFLSVKHGSSFELRAQSTACHLTVLNTAVAEFSSMIEQGLAAGGSVDVEG